MKLRLPLMLKSILLASMMNVSATYASTTPPAGYEEAAMPGASNVTVKWAPAPVPAMEGEEPEALAADAGDEEDAELEDEEEDLRLVKQDENLMLFPGKKTPATSSGHAAPARHSYFRGGFAGAMFSGVLTSSYWDDNGKFHLTFHVGKGEDYTVDETDTRVYWHRPETYDPAYFPQHWMHNGYSAVWVHSAPRIPIYYTPAPSTPLSTATSSTANSSSYAAAFSAPSFGGGGGGGGHARPSGAVSSKGKDKNKGKDKGKDKGEDEEKLIAGTEGSTTPAEENTTTSTTSSSTTPAPAAATPAEPALAADTTPATTLPEPEATASTTPATAEGQEGQPPLPGTVDLTDGDTTPAIAQAGADETTPATIGEPAPTAGIAPNAPEAVAIPAEPEPLPVLRLATGAMPQAAPALCAAIMEQPVAIAIAPAAAIEQPVAIAIAPAAAIEQPSIALPSADEASPTPLISGAAATGMFTKQAENTNVALWTGAAGGKDITNKGNWDIPADTFGNWNETGENKNNDGIIKFTTSVNLSGAGNLNTELINGSANNSGIVVTGNGTAVTMNTDRWLSMLQVDTGASLDLTLTDASNIKNHVAPGTSANVWVDGTLTIHNMGMCIANGWSSHEQNWFIGSAGSLTLDGNIRWTGPNAPYLTWHIQKQIDREASAARGTTIDILSFLRGGDVYTQLQAINNKGLLDIQVYDSTGQLMDGKVNLTSTGISVYVRQDLVWKGADGAQWTADGSFYKAPDNAQADATFQQWDKVTFNTAGANVAITGTVNPYKVNVQAATTFTGGTIETDEVNLSSSMTLTDTTLTTPAINVSGTAAISGNNLAFTGAGTVLNMGGSLTVTGSMGVAEINVTADSSIAGTVNATNMNLGGGHTLTVNSGVTPVNIKVAANQSGTLSAESSTDITSNVTVAAGANLIVGGQAHLKTRNANDSLSMDSTGKITLLGGDSSFYNGKETYTVKARTDLSEGLSSTIQGSGAVSLYSDDTTISNAVVTFNSYRHVNGTLTNCDVTTANNGENLFLTEQNNIHNLTVHGNTVVKKSMTINGALVVESGKSLSVNAGSAKLTINGTATINGSPAATDTGLDATSGQTIAIGSTGSVVVHSGMNVLGTLEIDMTGRVAGGSSAIIDASDGSFSLGSTGAIELLNYGDLSNGRYNLIKTNVATADTIVGKFENYFTANPIKNYAVSHNNGLVQLVISSVDATEFRVTADLEWTHDANYATDLPVYVEEGVTLKMIRGASDFNAQSHSSLGDITLAGTGSTFKIGTDMQQDVRTVRTTDKPVIESHFTLGAGSTMETEHGSWYFQGGLTVAGNAEVINNLGNGIVYGAINSSDPLADNSGIILTFKPTNADPAGDVYKQVITFKEAGNYGGTVDLQKATGSGDSYYVVDHANTFQNAEVKLTNTPNLSFDVQDAYFRKISGNGVLTGNNGAHGGDYTGVSTLHIGEASTISGTVGDNLILDGGNNALTLSGATITGTGSVTGSDITLSNATISGTGSVTGSDITLTGTLTYNLTTPTTTGINATGTLDITDLTSVTLQGANTAKHGLYTLAQGNIGGFGDFITAPENTADHFFTLVTTDNLVQLQIDTYENPTSSQVYTWDGSNTFVHSGSYLPTNFLNGTEAVVSDTPTTTRWADLFAKKVNDIPVDMASLRFDSTHGQTQKKLLIQFDPFSLGSVIVEEGAVGFSISVHLGSGTGRTLQFGSSDADVANSVVKENFLLQADSAENLANGALNLCGEHNITIAEDKTFRMDAGLGINLGGTMTLKGMGNLLLDGPTTVDGTANLTDSTTMQVAGSLAFGNDGAINVGKDATLRLTGVAGDYAGYSHITNNGLVLFGGESTLTGAPAFAGGSGNIGVDAGGTLTVTADLTSVPITVNKGTLLMTGDGRANLAGIDNSQGTISIANTQNITGAVGGDVKVLGTGNLTVAAGGSLTGTLTVDLTGATPSGADYLVTLATGSGQINRFALGFGNVADGVYNIVDTDRASAAVLKDMVGSTFINDHHIGTLITDVAGLQVDVHQVENPVAGQLYKWNGETSDMTAASYVLAEYEAATKTVYLSEANVLSDWNDSTSTSTGSQAGLHAVDIFGREAGDLGSLLFAADFEGSKAAAFSFTPLYLGGIVVQEGAEGYSIEKGGNWTRQLHLGSLTEESHSYIYENFSITTGTGTGAGDSGTFFRGTQDIYIAEGKTFTVTNNAANSGTLTFSGGGTMSIGGGLTNSGTITLDGTEATTGADKLAVTGALTNSGTINLGGGGTLSIGGGLTNSGTISLEGEANLTAASMLLTGSGARFNMTAGTLSLVNGSGLFNLHNGAKADVSGGNMTVGRIVIHDTADSSSVETMTISGGVVNVTSTSKTNNTGAAVLIGHWKSGQSGIALNVEGGVLNAKDGAAVISWNSPGKLNITGGEVNLNGIYFANGGDHHDNKAELILTNGARLNIGGTGIKAKKAADSISIGTATLGTLTASMWTLEPALALEEGTTFTIDTQVRQTNSTGATTQTENGGQITISGILSGTGDLEKVGKGTLTLSGANTASGNVDVKDGSVVFQNGGDNWTNVTVENGATLTYHSSSTKTDINNVENNGTLQIGNNTVIATNESMQGNGAVTVLGGGNLTSHNADGLANTSRITVSANGTLTLADGFNQTAGQRINNNGNIILGGTVALQSAEATLISNVGTITINQGTKFDMDAWEAQMQPGESLTKTLTLFTGLGTVQGNGALSVRDFYLGGVSLISSDAIRSISMNNQGVLTIQYWSTQNTDTYDESATLTEAIVLEHNNPKTVNVAAGETVVAPMLTSTFTEERGVITYEPGNYSFTKRGEGTLQILEVGGGQIDNFTVVNGKVVFGAAPQGGFTTSETGALRVHYDEATEEAIAAGKDLYVYDAAYGVYKPATDEQIAVGTGLCTRSYEEVTITKHTGIPAGDETGKKVVFDIGASRLTSMGGSVENVIYDYETHRITSVNPDMPAVMTDVELRLGNIINNDTSLVNVQFAGNSGLSGFVTVDQAGDNDLGANISVASGSTLTIGTASNNKLAFNFMPGTIKDHGAIGDANVWDHHLIDLGQDSNLVNWDNDHVAFYYNGILTKGIMTIGAASDTNDHLGVVHIDTDKTVELLWNGKGNAWNPTNTLSDYWYEGTNEGLKGGLYQHDWNDYEQTSRFYALSNVHFNTLVGTKDDGSALTNNIRLGQDLTVLNFTIGVKVDDSIFGDTDWNGIIDGYKLQDDLLVGNDARRTVYNKTAYTFSGGNLRVLRDLYVRTSQSLDFAGTFNIEAQNVYLYNSSETARVTFGGTLTADSLTIGQTGVDSDCYGIYTFNGAVELAHDLYIHVDSTSAIDAYTDQALFNSTLKVGGDAMLSGFGSKGFKGRVDIGRNLTVSSCMQVAGNQNHEGQMVATSSQASFSDLLYVQGDLILKNGGNAILFKRGSEVRGEVVMENGTLTLVEGTCNTFTNGGRDWTFKLIGDDGHLSLSPNSFAHIKKLYSGDGRLHDFTIEGNSRNTDVHSMADVKDLYINGGKITFLADDNGRTNTGGIHGDLYVGSTAAIFLNGNDVFSTDGSSHEEDGGHTITVDGGVVTLAAGTHQTMTDASKLVLNSAIILAPVTDGQTKGGFTALGDMAVDFTGTTAFGANISVNAGADADHKNTLTIRDMSEADANGLKGGLFQVGGAISAAENAQIVIDPGTRVYLEGLQASMSGDVYINSDHSDELHFLNSTLTVTQAGQIDNARISVGDGASLDVIANTPVNVEQLNLAEHSSIVLANLTGTKDLDASLSCIKVTDTADIDHHFNLYFKDDLQTMQTYALLSLTKEGGTQQLAANYQDLVNIYVRNWTDRENGEFEVVTLEKDQYELKVSEDGKTLYLATFFGMIWDGGVKAGDTDADGWWKPTNTDKNWTNKDWTEGQTAIFRDLGPEDNRTLSSTVHVQDTIHVDGIYVTAETTEYTFIGEGTTLRNQADDDPDITKNGAATFTMQDFGNEQLGKIDVNRGIMQIKGSTIDFTEELVVSEHGELKIYGGSSLSERVYEKDGMGGYVLDNDGHKILVTTPVGKLSALGTGEGDFGSFRNLKADEGLLSGASKTSPGLVSGGVVEGYTIKDITFSNANAVKDATFSTGVVNNGTLTLTGTTTFEHSITQGTGANLALGEGAIVDIGALEYTKDVTYGEGDDERLHTYHLFTEGGAGAGITDGTGEAHNLFTDGNVKINGALISKYSNNVLTVHDYDAAAGTITLELSGVETPHWDPAWGIDQKKSPWLGHLILTGDGKVANGNYMYFDNNAESATSGTYRYNRLLSEEGLATTQVNGNATSIVVSFRIDDATGKVFAAGNGKLQNNSAPTGEIWVYDTGSAFSTKIAGYVNGSTVDIANDGTISNRTGRLTATDLVTHMVLADTTNDPDHSVHTAHAIGGSVYVDSTGNSGTYISVMDKRVTVDELVGGNMHGNLSGDAHVYVHAGRVETMYAGSYNGSVNNVYLTVDGGSVGTIVGSTNTNQTTNGDVYAQLLAGEVGTFITGNKVLGDIQVDLSSKVTGLTKVQASTAGFANGKRATLKLINENGLDAQGNQKVFSLMDTQVEGFDIIDIGENGYVEFNVLGKFMTQSSGNRQVTLEGTGRVLLSNNDDRNGMNGTGKYWLTVTEGITLQLNNSFIHSQSEYGSYPTFEIQEGATFDISGIPVKDGGGIGIRLVVSGHGVDGKGAMYKAGNVGMKSNLTALPYITVKGNTSFGGTEAFCSDHNTYQHMGFVDMSDGGLEHTLTKQGSSTWLLQRITMTGGTLNIVDTSTVQLTQNSSTSPWQNTPSGNDALGTRKASSSTDIVLAPEATLQVDEGAYKNNNGQTYQINSFSARSLSGNGTLLMNNSHMYLYTEAANTDFYAEYRDSKQQFWNSEGYTYAVFGGKIADSDSTNANMLIKAGDGRQFLSGSESTYDGTTRMDDGILYLLGTSYGTMVKGTSTVSEGVLGTSHLEWNGGTVTLGDGVRIYNNGQALSGAAATDGVSEMLIRVNGLTAHNDGTGNNEFKSSVAVLDESKTVGGQTYYKLSTLAGVETVLCHGIYADGTRYYSGDVVDQEKGALYVLKNPYAQEVKNMSDLLVADTTKTVGDVVYTKVDTDGKKALSVAGVYNDGTAYTAGADLDTAAHGDLYVNTSSTATVTVTLPEAANVAVNSTYLMVQEGTFTSSEGVVYHKVDTTGINSLSVDGIYADGTTYQAGTTVNQDKDLYVQKAPKSMVFVTLSAPRFDDATYSGVLSDAQKVNGVGNKGRLVKVGLGTLTLDQYNAYTGGTDVRAGTLNVQGWGLLGGTNSKDVDQTAGSSLMLSYDGSYGDDECFFINTDMNITGRGDVRWSEESKVVDGNGNLIQPGYTAALISDVGKDFNQATNFTLAGVISGDGNVLHMGEGSLYIDSWKQVDRDGVPAYIHASGADADANTYTGGTTVTHGKVYVRKDAGLGATAAGLDANLVTLKGTEVHFEDSEVTLSAIQDRGKIYAGNSIEGKIVIGTADGTIRGTGAVQDGGTMQQVTGDVAVKPSKLVVQGNGYWSEDTKIDQDGALVFQGGAATNCGERFYDHTSTQGAGYLEGTGDLVLDNDGRNGALAVAFKDIGNGTDGFNGNIYVQGKNAALFFDDGDFNATKSAKQGTGNITISGENVGIVARESGITVASGSKITLASNTDTWKQGKTTYTVGEGENQMEIGPERAGGAAITAKYVTVTGGGTLEVVGGHVDGYGVDSIDNLTLDRLKAASTLTVAEAAANGSAISAWGDDEPVYTNVNDAGKAVTDVEGDIIKEAYNRVYEYEGSLNRTSVGVIDTQDYASGPLRLAANSNLVLKNSSLNLSGSALNLQRTEGEKINLSLEFGQLTYNELGQPSQIALFTDVDGLYISHENMLGTTPDVYENTGNDVYVFKANDYFQNCWQITDETLLVYDTKARVIYLDYAVPEPTTGALSVLALAALAARRRRKH